MDRYVLAFIKSSLAYFLLGTVVGVTMAVAPAERGLTYHLLPTHAHLNLLGWLSMMVYGVAYHVLPRFSGRPLHSPRLAWAHFAVSHLGLIGMALFFALNRWQAGRWLLPLRVAAAFSGLGTLLFVYNLWRTLPGLRPSARLS